jgi:hypothetical protein
MGLHRWLWLGADYGMRLREFYYLDYPNDSPIDRSNAYTTMYVGIEEPGEVGIHIYAVTVCTLRYLEENYISKNIPFLAESVLIIPELNDDYLMDYLSQSQNLQKISEVGEIR